METILIRMGEFMVVTNPVTLTCIGLGSCVGVTLYDSVLRLGALGHIVLPHRNGTKDRFKAGRFADSAIQTMIEGMEERGSQRRRIEAKVFGGANMFPHISSHDLFAIGERNVRAVKEELAQQRIQIVAQDVGGSIGRTIFFDLRHGTVRVRCAQREEKVF